MRQWVRSVSRHVQNWTPHREFHWQPKGKMMDQATYIKKRVDGHSRKVRKREPWATEIAAETACLSPIRCDLPVFPRVAMTVGRPMALLGYRKMNQSRGVRLFPQLEYAPACAGL